MGEVEKAPAQKAVRGLLASLVALLGLLMAFLCYLVLAR